MAEYEPRLVIGLGLPNEIIAIECLDDEAALEAAEMLVDGHDVELWRGPLKLGTLHHYMRTLLDRPERTNDVISFRSSLNRFK